MRPPVPPLAAALEEMQRYFAGVGEGLVEAWGADGEGRERATATIGMALDPAVWQALARQGVNPRNAAELMCGFVQYAALGCRDQVFGPIAPGGGACW